MSRHGQTESWYTDWEGLTPAERDHFRVAFQGFRSGLPSGTFPKSLQVRPVQGAGDIYQLAWAADGYATFSCAPDDSDGEGKSRTVWRRIGAAEVLDEP